MTVCVGEYTEWSEWDAPSDNGDGFYLDRYKLTLVLCSFVLTKWDDFRGSFGAEVAKARLAAENQRMPFYEAANDHRRNKPYRWERVA